MSFRSSNTRIILIGVRGWHANGWKKAAYGSQVEEVDEKNVDFEEPTSFFDHVHLGCTCCECKPNEKFIRAGGVSK